MNDSRKSPQLVMELAKFLNVFLTAEQIAAVEKMLALGVTPVNLVRLIQNLGSSSTLNSPSNRENSLQ
uniref:Mitotic-spindle organizing protein 1 n=1 Tax=Caenorhabditis japonica TaxID=281687 RepID=A0A8R1DHP9_CAEJA